MAVKYILIVIFSLTLTSVYCQNAENKESKKIQVGVYYSLDRCFRNLEAVDENDTSSLNFIDYRNYYEELKYGFTSGISIRYELKNRLLIETGLQYSDKGYQRRDYVYLPSAPDSTLYIINRENFKYLSIPLQFNTYFFKKKIGIYSSFGISTDFLVDATHISKVKGSDKYKNVHKSQYDYNLFNVTPFIGLGVDFTISKNMNLQIEPTFRYSILKTIDEKPITSYLWNSGIRISLNFKR
jgi:hypothetical protein